MKLWHTKVTKCSFCTHISSVVSGCERVPPPLKNISSKSISSIKFCEEIDDTLTDNKTIDYEDQNAKKKFSFLQKSSRRSSAPGRIGIEDFIPLGDSNPAPKSGFSFFQKAKNASLNNNNINKNNGGSNLNDIPINAALSLKLGIVNLEEEGSEKVILTGIKRPLNLLELEQMNKKEKKNRRKTLDQNSKNTATPNRSNASSTNSRIPNVGFEINTKGSASLSSLQNMFMKK